MTNNKAPGPDRFAAEFYNEFWTILSPTVHRMLQEFKENGRLPPKYANISLPLKPGKALYLLPVILQYP